MEEKKRDKPDEEMLFIWLSILHEKKQQSNVGFETNSPKPVGWLNNPAPDGSFNSS